MPDAPVLLAGRYRLGKSLGRGGMGQVLLARDETLQRDVAIKEIDQPFGAADGGASARRTLREARASARINHPNVVQVYDVLQLDDRTWIVMEYVPSRSLREEIAEQGQLDTYRVARIGLELLGALRTAHRLGVEHRDVKPANVLLADDGRVLLTDFGIAAVDDDGVISRSDILVGSPQFMAPERAQGRPSGPEADLWSLGATLYAAIEGRAPYQRGSTMATLAALATEEPDAPTHSGVLRPLLDGLLRKDPATRMTAEDAEGLARSILTGLSSSGEAPAPRAKPSGLAGFAAGLPAMFRIPRPRASGERLPARGDSATPDRDAAPLAGAASGAGEPAEAGCGAGEPAETRPGAGEPADTRPDAVEPVVAAADARAEAATRTGPGTASEAGAEAGSRAGTAAVAGEGTTTETGSEAGAEDEAGPGDAAVQQPAAAGGDPDAGGRARVTEVPRPEPATKATSAAGPVGATGAARRRRSLLMAVAALSVVLVVGIGWALAGRPDGPQPQSTGLGADPTAGATAGVPAPATTAASSSATPSSAASSSATPSSAASPAASPSPAPTSGQRPALPPGWVEYRDSTGFSLYVPAGWKRSKEGTIVYFRGDGKILGIDQTDEPKADPVKDWRNQADNRVAGGDFPQYEEVGIEEVKYFRKAADWEFTFMRDGVRRHVNNRGTVVSKNRAYGIYWQTPDSEWFESRDDLQLVFDSFVPAKE